MEPEQLIARVQELTGRLEDLDDPACRGLAEELTARGRADVRRRARADRRAGRREDPRRDGGRRARRRPADDPRPVSRSRSRSGSCEALDTRQAVHGVARRQRRAARDRGRGREAAPRGQLQVVPGVVVDARAGGAAGARDGGARPRGHGRGGVVEEDEAGVSGDPAADRADERRAVVAHARDRRARRDWSPRTWTACRWWWRTSTARCSPTATRAPAAAAPLDGGALDGGALRCPACGRRYFLPQAGRSMDDDHLQLEPVPLLREQEEIKVAL